MWKICLTCISFFFKKDNQHSVSFDISKSCHANKISTYKDYSDRKKMWCTAIGFNQNQNGLRENSIGPLDGRIENNRKKKKKTWINKKINSNCLPKLPKHLLRCPACCDSMYENRGSPLSNHKDPNTHNYLRE